MRSAIRDMRSSPQGLLYRKLRLPSLSVIIGPTGGSLPRCCSTPAQGRAGRIRLVCLFDLGTGKERFVEIGRSGARAIDKGTRWGTYGFSTTWSSATGAISALPTRAWSKNTGSGPFSGG